MNSICHIGIKKIRKAALLAGLGLSVLALSPAGLTPLFYASDAYAQNAPDPECFQSQDVTQQVIWGNACTHPIIDTVNADGSPPQNPPTTGICDTQGFCHVDTATNSGGALSLDLDYCASQANYKPTDYTAPIVYCVRQTIQNGVTTMLQQMSDFMKPTVTLVLVFAVALFGIKILAGEEELTAKTVSFLIRLGLVAAFSYNLNNMASAPFNILDELISWVAPGGGCPAIMNADGTTSASTSVWPWCAADNFLGRLMGFGPNILLFQGFLGVIGTALFSTSAGVSLFLSGILALLNLIFFVFEIVFAYLSSILAIAFLTIMSPIIIPLAMFERSERYFRQWLNQLISALLGPVLLFGFLSMTLSTFTGLIDNTFSIIGSKDNPDMSSFISDAHELLPSPLGVQWVPSEVRMTQQNVTNGKSVPAIQNNIDPHGYTSTDTSPLTVFAVNFGPNNLSIMQQLVLSFIALWIYASMMKSMIQKIPQIASDIAGSVGMMSMQSGSFQDQMYKGMDNLRVGGGAIVGGVSGGALGGATGKMFGKKYAGVGRELGVITGGLFGAAMGKRL